MPRKAARKQIARTSFNLLSLTLPNYIIIFLDLLKAFDSVPHERLLTKIHAYGIQGPLLSWLRSFLTNRSQRVVLRGHYSSWIFVLSGVPQGTVLESILFLIYIYDISSKITSNTKLFVDDMEV